MKIEAEVKDNGYMLALTFTEDGSTVTMTTSAKNWHDKYIKHMSIENDLRREQNLNLWLMRKVQELEGELKELEAK
jgi:hypothetical protein